jgi:hypothetical protein
MKRRAQHGLLLLPVALALAIAGAVAYAVSRESSMSASAVHARYEYEAARYLAEGGINLAVWQNAKRSCAAPVTFDSLEMAGGTISAEGAITSAAGGSKLAMTIVASFNGASYRIQRVGSDALQFYDLAVVRDVDPIKTSDGNDTFIRQGTSADQRGLAFLEVSDAVNGNAHALLQFPTGSIPKGARLIQAGLRMYLKSYSTVQSKPTLSLHRVTRAWPDNATWTSPWITPGGEYVATPETTTALGASPLFYSLPITTLVDRWVNKSLPNSGVLLRTSGMTNANYASSEAGDPTRPLLFVSYNPACT